MTIMLSYNWNSQALVSKIYNILVENGFKVWMDINGGMQDNINVSMAEGIENADVICCFMTPSYQTSRNCQLELEYANKRGIRIIPCMVGGDNNEKKWTPSSWLGFLTSGLNYINFRDHSDTNVELKARELINRIKDESTTPPAQSNMSLKTVIKQKYLRENRMERLVNKEKNFSIEQSYINLALVETKEQHDKEKKLKQQGSKMQGDENEQSNNGKKYTNSILGTYEEIYGIKTSINVKNIFDKCKNQTKRILVLGRAGIGKSTFCQYVTHQWAKGEIWSQYEMILLIRLRKFTDTRYRSAENISPIDLVKKEFCPFNDLSNEDEQNFQNQCNIGKVLWILDGYDEFAQNIPDQLRDVFEYIVETQHHILTSRPYAIDLTYDVKMEITGFTDNNIAKYIEHFFDQLQDEIPNAKLVGNKVLNFLKENSSIWGICHIPVNLELICSLWSDTDWSKKKSLTMTALYENITEWLCRRQLGKQNIKHEQMRKKKVYDQCNKELRFLERLAFNAMKWNEIILPPTLIEKTENETECCFDDHPQLLNFGILKSYDDKPSGNQILAEKQYYFIHLSFQEYFAARHLIQTLTTANKEQAINFIKNHKYNRRFLYVFIFASGLLTQAEYQSCVEVYWATIQGEPLDLVGLIHTKLIIECFDEFGGQASFRRSADYLKSISQWLDIGHHVRASTVIDNLLQSLGRTNFICNTSIIQNKLIELLDTEDRDVQCKVYLIMSQVKIWAPIPKLLAKLVHALWNKHDEVRLGACDALGKLSKNGAIDEVIPDLIQALQNGNSDIKEYVCDALCYIGEKAATKEMIVTLINVLQDENSHVRHYVYEALQNMGEKAATNEVIDALVHALHDRDSDVRYDACQTLGKIGEKAVTHEVVASLIHALGDEDCSVRENVCQTFQKIGAKAVTTCVITRLIDALRDEDPDVRECACKTLGKFGDTTTMNALLASLIKALHDEDPSMRKYACETLGNLGEKIATDHIMHDLLHLISDDDSEVRRYACQALGNMGEKAATNEVISGLIKAIHDDDSDVIDAAFESLEKMSETSVIDEVLAGLINALADEDYNIREHACVTLGMIGENAATNEVLTAVISTLRDDEPTVRQEACQALGMMGEKAATNEVLFGLIHALRDKQAKVRQEVCLALGMIGEKAATNEVIDALRNALLDKNPCVRQYACEAFGSIGEKGVTNEVIAGLIIALGDKNSDVREAACEAFGNMGEKAIKNLVIVALWKIFAEKVKGSNNFTTTEPLEQVMGCYNVMKQFNVTLISQLYLFMKQDEYLTLTTMPPDQFIKLFLETENDAWLPLITYAALVQGVALTILDDTIKIYHVNEVMNLPVKRPELIQSLIKALRDQQAKLNV